uniref:5'-AMP-activated protein kinase subunit beta-1 n=1 Tax=Trichobilharzia regenti TaxID=157069 RepID=A0AA85K0L4_TRIRE|nr:unnamed protein product [Trichobilharzia regenti]
MGNTPVHHKRRYSGDADGRSSIGTPPGVNVTIPPMKRRNMHSLSDLSQSAPADYLDEIMSTTCDDKDAISIDEATSMLRAASLREPIGQTVADDADKIKRHLLHPRGIVMSPTESNDNEGEYEEEKYSSVGYSQQPSTTAAGLSSSADERIIYGIDHRQVAENAIPRHYRAKTLPAKKVDELKLPTVFRWNGGGKEIYISGTFNNWKKKIPMVKRNSGVYVIVDCQPGTHQYKYYIDGAWYHDPTKPTVDNEYGTKNNVVCVNESDFDVLHALEQDQACSRKRSDSSDSTEVDSLGHSPPGEYGRFMPASLGELQHRARTRETGYHSITPGVGTLAQPPLLPPHLLQGILNMDTNLHCDPNLLPQPNHVIVNHLYALSIKDGVIVLSVITRFRQKFVSTLFYRPIER